MGMISVTKVIDAPPDRVFDVFSDLRTAPERIAAITRIEVLTDGPIGVGTRWRETRVMFRREATETMEITAFDPPHSYTALANSCGCRYEFTFRFEPQNGGTKVTAEFDWRAQSFLAKLFSPMFRLMASTCVKAIDQDLSDLKVHCEQLQPA